MGGLFFQPMGKKKGRKNKLFLALSHRKYDTELWDDIDIKINYIEYFGYIHLDLV